MTKILYLRRLAWKLQLRSYSRPDPRSRARLAKLSRECEQRSIEMLCVFAREAIGRTDEAKVA
jgi:hypothetical protein